MENYYNFASFNLIVDTKTSIILMGPNIRGLGFKYVDPGKCYKEIKMISSENILFYLSYKILSIAPLIIVSTQQIKHNDSPSPGARRGNFDVKTTSNFN